jgi:hypothetical protein
MEAIDKVRKCALCLFILLITSDLTGQIRNKYDIHFKYLINNETPDLGKTYINKTYGCQLPAILGNLEQSHGYELGLLYSNRSFLVQPGFIFTHLAYEGNRELQLLYRDRNFKVKSNAFGLTCKVNFSGYGRKWITPYFRLNASLALTKLKSTPDNNTPYKAVATSNTNSDVSYEIEIMAQSSKSTAVNPIFGGVLGAEWRLIDQLFFISELGINLRNYPDFDAPSPGLVKESSLSVGLRYKMLKDKRFLLR